MKHITTDELRAMTNCEGLIIQGCGGDLSEWITGINDILAKEGILQNGDSFKEVYAFEHDGLTNLLFSMENVDLDVGRLAMWRLQSHSSFGGTWLSDYLPNRLGVDMEGSAVQNEKPNCALIGQNGNIFNLMGIASRTLKENGLRDQAKEMQGRITASDSYDEALCIIGEYVNIVSDENSQEQDCEFELEQSY